MLEEPPDEGPGPSTTPVPGAFLEYSTGPNPAHHETGGTAFDLTNPAVFEAMVQYNRTMRASRLIYARGHHSRNIILVLLTVHQLSMVCAVVLGGISIYVLAAPWGGLEPTFFTNIGICSLLFSFIVFLISLIGWASLSRVVCRYTLPADVDTPPGHVTLPLWLQLSQPSLLVVHSVLLLAGMCAEIYVLAHSFNALAMFTKTLEVLKPQLADQLLHETVPSAPFSEIEAGLALRFNTFFFGAMASCVNSNFAWWWAIIADNCQPSLGINRCVSCDGLSITSCAGDSMSCLSYTSPSGSPQEPSAGIACPYSICREGITQYLVRQINPFAYTLLAFLALQASVLIGNAIMYSRMQLLLSGHAGSGFNEALASICVDERDLVRAGEVVRGQEAAGRQVTDAVHDANASVIAAGGARRGMHDGRGDAFLPPQTLEEEERQIREALARSELEESEVWDEGMGVRAGASAGEGTGGMASMEAVGGSVGSALIGATSLVDSALGYLGASLGVTTVSSPTGPSPQPTIEL